MAAAPGRRRESPPLGASRRSRSALGGTHTPGAVTGAGRVGVRTLWQLRRSRLALTATAIALPLLGGGWLLLRNSPFVAVQRVQISGVHGAQASEIDAALTAAARRESTLNVSAGNLRSAVA